jgi:carboxylesterase
MFHFGQAYQAEQYQPFYWQGSHGGALMVHGFPGHPGDMRAIATHLHQRGWTTDVPLLPGFGSQIDQLPEYRYEDWIATMQSHLNKIVSTYRPAILVGYSMGGALSMALAARTNIDALILFAPFWRLEHILWQMLPTLKWVVPSFKPIKLLKVDLDADDVRAGLLEMMPDLDISDPNARHSLENFRMPTHVIDQVRIAGQNGYAHAAKINVPTLIVQGTKDDLVAPKLTRALAEKISGPVTYVEVAADHALLEDSQPSWSQVVDAVDTFIETNNLGAMNE